MPTTTRNAWFRHQQQSRTGAFRLVHFQLFGALALALGVFTLVSRMHPSQAKESTVTERARPERSWSHMNGDQLLTMLGMGLEAPLPSEEETHITMHQRTNVSVKVSARENGTEPAPTANLTTPSPPVQGPSAGKGKEKADPATAEMEMLAKELQKVLQDPQGIVPRLNTSVDRPFGPNDRDHNPMCTAFRNAKAVALVGNGPLDKAQRAEVDTCDIVVRFNLMNNWRRLKEKVDVWVIRYSTEASLGYWGITNMPVPEAANVTKLMKAMWLVGGRQKKADSLVEKVPAVADAHPVLIPQESLAAAYGHQMNVTASYPSTGFVGVLGALHCTPEDTVLHLFGFNWHNSTWKAHKMDMEKEFVEGLARQGRVVIHETTCYGVRECGGSSTFDASCHWNGAGRYMCLRGKPRKWTDLTDTLGSGRLEQFRGQAVTRAPATGATALLR